MEIPEAYYHYAASFYPDMLEEISSEEDFIVRGLRFLTKKQLSDLKMFLPRALDGGCTIAELQQAWMRAGPIYGFNDRDLPVFLRMTVKIMTLEASRLKRIPGR